MKKRLAAFLVALSVIIPVALSTGCYFEDDFYGVYFNESNTSWLTLGEDHFASLVLGNKPETYYAEYLIYSNTIYLRDKENGNWGKIMYTITINPDDIKELTLKRGSTKVDENGNDYYDDSVPDVVFVLNRNYKPQ